MESLWNNIEQCEKRLDDMDGQQDQVDSATHGDILKVCNNVVSWLVHNKFLST